MRDVEGFFDPDKRIDGRVVCRFASGERSIFTWTEIVHGYSIRETGLPFLHREFVDRLERRLFDHLRASGKLYGTTIESLSTTVTDATYSAMLSLKEIRETGVEK